MPLPNDDPKRRGGFPAHHVKTVEPTPEADSKETSLKEAEDDVAKAEAALKQAETTPATEATATTATESPEAK